MWVMSMRIHARSEKGKNHPHKIYPDSWGKTRDEIKGKREGSENKGTETITL